AAGRGGLGCGDWRSSRRRPGRPGARVRPSARESHAIIGPPFSLSGERTERAMSLLATKKIETLTAQASEQGEHTLKRVLGPINLVTLGIGAIIGTGIFVLTGQVAAANTGPAIVLS